MSLLHKIHRFLRPPLTWHISAKSITGGVRGNNEDRVLYSHINGSSIAILTDGVGGSNAGDVAAQFVCESLKEWFASRLRVDDLSTSLQQLQTAILAAHDALYQQSQQQPEKAGMATTLALLMQHQRHAIIAWAGDSRIYLNRRGKLLQLSVDHSYVEEKIQQGAFARAEAENHPKGNIITSFIGGKPRIAHLDIKTIKLKQDDRLLIVSDGISDVLPAGKILQLMPGGVDALLEESQLAQSADNCSAIIIEVL